MTDSHFTLVESDRKKNYTDVIILNIMTQNFDSLGNAQLSECLSYLSFE
jgi:hypothetical protein